MDVFKKLVVFALATLAAPISRLEIIDALRRVKRFSNYSNVVRRSSELAAAIEPGSPSTNGRSFEHHHRS